MKLVHKRATQWGRQQLLSLGYALKTEQPEIVQDTPWSYVTRFLTSDGTVYLKQTPKPLALEASIIEVLRDQFNAPVPEVITYNEALNCFLMKDAGQSLRGILKQQFDETLLIKAIDQFTALQRMVADDVDSFLNMGVPDYRLENLPELYRQLVSQKEVLIADGLSEAEVHQLRDFQPLVLSLCNKLSSYAIKQTMVQPDFNDNNTVMDAILKKITIIDLGEIAISHPFFSLLNFLHVIKKHHALTETTAVYLKLKTHCFKHFNMDEKNLSEAIELAQALFFVYAALASYRLLSACDKAKFTGSFQRHGRLSPSLKAFIQICSNIKWDAE